MKKVLVLPYGFGLSHVGRTLEVSRELRTLGVEVIFAGNGKFMYLPEEAGFPVLPLVDLDFNKVLDFCRSKNYFLFNSPTLREHVNAELELIRETSPDVVLSDFRLSARVSTILAGVPYASILNAAWTNYYAASFDPGLKITNIDAFLNETAAPFTQLLQDSGRPCIGNLLDYWAGDLTIIADVPEFGPTKDLPGSFHYAGPITWVPQIPDPPWLDQLDPSRPTIYMTMGSTGFVQLFQYVIQLFGNTRYQCIVTTGGLVDLPAHPQNFYITDFASGYSILRKSNVIICHGGHGTVYQAMYCGVPIIGIPTMGDQYVNLERVAALGLGINLKNVSMLKESVEKILSSPAYHQNAQRVASDLKKYNGPKTAAALVANMASN